MVTISNKLRQPLPIILANKESIHFLAKESKEITQEQFNSPEIQENIEKGNLVVTRLA